MKIQHKNLVHGLIAAGLCLACMSACSTQDPVPVLPGGIYQTNFYSATLERTLSYAFYLPPSYGVSTNTRYEVLYLLHGSGGTELDWVNLGGVRPRLDSWISSNLIREVIVIMPSGGNTWWVNRFEKMQDAIILDLIPQVNSWLRVKTGRAYTSIGGNSAGGYGALRLLLAYPDIFTNAILMSPAAYLPYPDSDSSARTTAVFRTNNAFSESIWASLNYTNFWDEFDAYPALMHQVYVSVGLTDNFEGILLAVTNQLSNAFTARPAQIQQKTTNLTGGHSWTVWTAAFETAIKDYYRK